MQITCIKSQNPYNNSYKWKYYTTAHKLLQMEENAFRQDSVHYGSMYRLLDSLIEYTSKRIKPILQNNATIDSTKAIKILNTIDQSLTELNFITYIKTEMLHEGLIKTKINKSVLTWHSEIDVRENYDDEYFFTSVKDGKNRKYIYMTTKRLEHFNNANSEHFYTVDCDLSAYLFLAIGEANNLPFFLVEVPNHFFIRYQIADSVYLNWDTNSANVFTDSDYKKGLSPTTSKSFSDERAKEKNYLTNYSDKEIKGYHFERVAGYSIRNHQYQKAKEQIELAIKYRPYSITAKETLGEIYILLSIECLEKGNNFQSEIYLKKALQFCPKEQQWYDIISNIHNSIGYDKIKDLDFKSATKYFEKAIHYKPNNGYAYDNMSYCLIRLGDMKAGKIYFEKAIETGNNNKAYSFRNIALYYREIGDFSKAKQYYELAYDNISIHVDFLDYHYGEFLFAIGEEKKAINYLKIAANNNEKEAALKLKEINNK